MPAKVLKVTFEVIPATVGVSSTRLCQGDTHAQTHKRTSKDTKLTLTLSSCHLFLLCNKYKVIKKNLYDEQSQEKQTL